MSVFFILFNIFVHMKILIINIIITICMYYDTNSKKGFATHPASELNSSTNAQAAPGDNPCQKCVST